MPVNQSTHTPEQKPLLYYPAQKSKSIRKLNKPLAQAKPHKLTPISKAQEPIFHNHSLNSSFESSPSADRTTHLNSSSGGVFNVLQPFCNYGLFPSALQKIVSGSAKLEQTEIVSSIYQLKTPENQLNFQKKIEKMKLLTLGQETVLQNYMKDKFLTTQKPHIIRDYYRFQTSKNTLMTELQELRLTLVANNNESTGDFSDENNNRLQEELSFLGPRLIDSGFLMAKTSAHPQPLLYDTYMDGRHECFSQEQKNYSDDDGEKDEEYRAKKESDMKFMCFYDEDRFLAKEEEFRHKI